MIKLMPCKHIPYCVRCFGDFKKTHEKNVAKVQAENGKMEAGEPLKDLPVFACPCCRKPIEFAGSREEVRKWVEDDYMT
ncbi:unnamed protein product [Vitrella brassicaformis CCMP3155]|uniref:Uncharacterized protein n=1 Tax=Vitrella brassicaformis (strain CCMP3155) TaxID=1169540 RepID=A0A0G4EZF0_VITBC|nr:unnamed protein product [Vitrella brassicaformis CCMP3155]|eukprot:CEM04714.1 unnamed protein product [Vitrella brassicaformis CCMP3155]